MDVLLYVFAGLFLPLFPLSLPFNALLARSASRWRRALLILLWPQIGLALASLPERDVPAWIPALALFTAALYALRLLAMRDVGRWLGLLATSAWALLWLAVEAHRFEGLALHGFALWFSLPLVGAALVTGSLESRFGAAYAGLNMALAASLPRLSGVWVLTILAATATPLFPGFFVMLALMGAATPIETALLLLIWLVWSWGAARLTQGMIVGTRTPDAAADLKLGITWLYAVAMAAAAVAGLATIEVFR